MEPSDELKPFYPVIKGVRNGVDLSNLGQLNAFRVIHTSRYLLLGPNGSVDAYRDHLKENLGDAIREDLVRILSQQSKVVQRQDSVVMAYAQISKNPAEAERALEKLRENEESQTAMEAQNAWIALNLDEPVR